MKSDDKTQPDRGARKKKPGAHTTRQLEALQTKIQETEDLFQIIFDNSPDGMVIVNPTENAEGPWLIENCNRSFCEMNGFDRSELIGKDIRVVSVVSNETASEVELPNKYHEKITGGPSNGKTHRRESYQRLKQGPIRIEEIHKRKDGGTFNIQSSSCLMTLSGQERVLVIDRDITERKRNEEQIQILSKFPAENPYPIMRIAQDGVLVYANKSSVPLLARWNIRIGQAMPKEWQTWIAEVVSSRQNKEVEIKCGERVFSCMLVPIVDAGYINVYGRDITEFTQTEEALRMSERRFREMQENVELIAVMLNAEGRVTFCNDYLLRLTGRSRVDVLGQDWFAMFVPPELQVEDVFRTALQHGTIPAHFENEILNASGERRLVTWNSIILLDAKGSIIGTNSLGEDITERKQNELIQNTIYRITQTAITSEGTDTLYHSIHSILGELIPAENFFIALYDSTNELISFPYFIDQYDEPPPAPTQILGLTGYVIRTGRPLLATREIFDRLVQQGEVEAVGTVCVDWLGVPLKVGGRMIGVMAVQSYTQGIHYDQEDMDLLEFVSTQVAQAIERKRLEEEIRSLSLTDELTGLYNRRGFTLLAEQEGKLAHRKNRAMLLFFGDVDGLKTINDTLGHAYGDLALKEVSAILKKTFREADILARIGGDEFVVLALDASIESAEILTNRIQAVLEARNQHGDKTYFLTLSLGIARYDPETPCTVSELIAQADGLMYLQKQARNGKK